MIQRIFFIAVVSIIAFVAFSFLWIVNPLYVFVGGVVVVVFMMVGSTLVFNMIRDPQTLEDQAALQPRRTGEFRQVRASQRPEDSWDQHSMARLKPRAIQNFTEADTPTPESVPESQADDGAFDTVAEQFRQQMQSGQLGDSIEDVQAFFDAAFEKAQKREVSDYISREEQAIRAAKQQMQERISESHAPPEPEAPAPQSSGDFDLMKMLADLPPEQQERFFSKMTEIPIGEQTETQLIALYQHLVNAEPLPALDEIHFSAFYPRRAAANTEYGLYVYAHLPDALVAEDVEQFEDELGGRVPKITHAQEVALIEDGISLTAMIDCEGLQFNQVGSVQMWHAPFVRFDFRFRAAENLIDEIVNGKISIRIGLIEIASIAFQIVVAPVKSMAIVNAIPQDPRNAYNYNGSDAIAMYQKIFISYSRKDRIVAEQFRNIQMMSGNVIFMDTHTLRSGEDWEQKLKHYINEADVFQLFWSEAAAESEHVRFEWEYALKQRCPQTKCVHFIRPAYWTTPLPDIPSELDHLHFAYVDLETDG